MNNEDKINELLKRAQASSEITSQAVLEGTVSITGILMNKNDGELLVAVGKSILYINLADIKNVTESESQPAVSPDQVEITVTLNPESKVKVLRMVEARQFASRIGMKPLVYDVPSQASQFAIPEEQYEEEYQRFLDQANLSDFPTHSTAPTFRLTPMPTGRPTQYWTPYRTTTQNADSTTDQKGDTKTDYSTDYETDVD